MVSRAGSQILHYCFLEPIEGRAGCVFRRSRNPPPIFSDCNGVGNRRRHDEENRVGLTNYDEILEVVLAKAIEETEGIRSVVTGGHRYLELAASSVGGCVEEKVADYARVHELHLVTGSIRRVLGREDIGCVQTECRRIVDW